ncbi:HEAT repeat domain-containing protein [Parachlamydia sp. AcF125]|uniref:HEAT repeat domain-containing protein n=1 Tax=Parachlamydia sp. AcF125 TaxID=2795736 RepID=UPI001BC9F77F|nr:HEAT repeat domain-containing protein [Parachlamydia sp. AcF125]MBS4168302.1 Phosphocholine transferase AnkX [Parachlamydia sp. AcF125]
MRINASFLVKADQVSDYIPGLSTIANLIDLFHKCAVLPAKQKANISNSHYYTYLQQKGFSRCVVLLIPVIGNVSVAIYDFAKSKYKHKNAALATARPVPPSASQASPNCTPPESIKGLVVDTGRQLGKHAKSLVMSKREVRVSNAVQQDYSQATLMAGCNEKTAQQLAIGVYEKQSQGSSPLVEWSSDRPGYCEHSFKEPFMALYPHLTQPGPLKPLAIVKDNQLAGSNSHMHIYSSSVIHYGMRPSRLSEAELHKKLKDLQQLRCPSCIKDLIVQGHKFLKEIEEEAALHGVFYLATAYELHLSLNIQEYSFERQALNQYLGKLENSLKEGESLLHYFATHENRSIFIYLFAERPNIKSHMDTLAGNLAKETPLHIAIKSGSIPIVQFLLEQGADVKKLDSLQNNALHHACQSKKDCEDLVRILLQYEPALMEAKNGDGQTPLRLAALTGNEKSVEYLLGQFAVGAKLDHQDKDGNTPLHLAIIGKGSSSKQVAGNYAKIIVALVKKGANLHTLNHKKQTVLALILENKIITKALVRAKLSPQILVSFLQDCYLSQETLSIFRIKAQQNWEFKVPLEEIYVRLGMIEHKGRNTCDQIPNGHSEYLQDARIPTYETILEPKEKVEIEQLFGYAPPIKQEARKIYVQGTAGIGKSTLCHYIAYRWAKGQLWQASFTYLFWIPLRNLTLRKYPDHKKYTAVDLIAKEYEGKIPRSVLEACLNDVNDESDNSFRKKSLLILDGYDELSADAQANTSLAAAFKQLKELFPNILITSRPGSCYFERSCELELLGFDKEGVNRYIDRFFKHVQAEEKKEKLYHLLNASPQVLSLAQIPINLTLLCCLFNEDPQIFDNEQTVTMSTIYARVVNWMYQWFLLRRIDQRQSRQTKEQILAEKNLRQNPEVAYIAAAFEEMADFAMKNNTLYLSKQEIEDFRGNKISSNELADCGLMRIPEAEEKGYFIHLTFQEFLAASKVANQYLTGERQACQAFVQNYKFEPRYALVLRMIAGSLSLATSNNRRYGGALQSFFDDLFAMPHDLAINSELVLIADCFEECQDPTVVKQYDGFIELLKDYMKYLCLQGLGFERFLSNKNLLNHPEIVRTITELLFDPQTNQNMLKILVRTEGAGLSLTSEIIGVIVEELKDPKKDSKAKRLASYILEETVRQRGELPKEALAALIQAFQEGDRRTKVRIFSALRTIINHVGGLSEEALAALIQALKEGDNLTKDCVAYALKEVAIQGGKFAKEALAALIQVLKESDNLIKSCAIKALGAMAIQGGELAREALAALIQAFQEGDSEIKDCAASALGTIAKQEGELAREALAALIQALKEDDRGTKDSAASALGTIVKQGGELSEEGLAVLVQALKEDDRRTKDYAVFVLRAIAEQGDEFPEEGLAVLIQAFKEGDEETRRSAAGTLGAIATQGGEFPEEGLAALIQVLKEEDSLAKGYADSALGRMGQQEDKLLKEALVALIRAFKEGDEETKSSAAGTLGAIARQGYELPEEGLVALIRAFKEGDRRTKDCAAFVLGAIAEQRGELPKEGLAALIQAFKEGDGETKRSAASGLREITKQGIELLKEGLAALIQALKEGDNLAKSEAARALGIIAMHGYELPKEGLVALIQAFKEGDRRTKDWATFALKAIAEQRGELPEKGLAALIQALKEDDSNAQRWAANALEAIAIQGGELSKEVLAALIETLKEGDNLAKGEAASALETMATQGSELSKEVLAALIETLTEGDRKTRAYATDALQKVDKDTLLKMSRKAFALIAKVCFFTKSSFSVKGQRAQISDKRITYACEERLTLTYEEIREQLPLELAIWRARLDSLSPTEVS